MKIAFIWWWDRAKEIYPDWRDGLRAAIEELAKTNRVDWFLGKDKLPKPGEFDAIIFWDDSNSSFFELLDEYKTEKKALCLTTDPQNFDNLRKLDVVYCESLPVYDSVRSQGIRAIRAFGTDTNFYIISERKKNREYFYPATFSPWKRQSEIAYLGDRLTCIGTVQPDGVLELQECLKNGVNVEEGYYPPEKIRSYYQTSEKVIIPAIHGSERTVLEAMACGIIPEVTNKENLKTYSYILELQASGLDPREFVVKNYSHTLYAEQLLKGISLDRINSGD